MGFVYLVFVFSRVHHKSPCLSSISSPFFLSSSPSTYKEIRLVRLRLRGEEEDGRVSSRVDGGAGRGDSSSGSKIGSKKTRERGEG